MRSRAWPPTTAGSSGSATGPRTSTTRPGRSRSSAGSTRTTRRGGGGGSGRPTASPAPWGGGRRGGVGKRTPICILGASAGGQMALMVALQRPDVACVIAHAPPTVLESLPPGLVQRARSAFDWLGGLDVFSPARYALETPLLLVQATE